MSSVSQSTPLNPQQSPLNNNQGSGSAPDLRVRQIFEENIFLRTVDNLIYRAYFYINPPSLLPISKYYDHRNIPSPHEYFLGHAKIKSYEESKAWLMEHIEVAGGSLGPVPKWTQAHLDEFENPEDRMRQARDYHERCLNGVWGLEFERSARMWSLFTLCSYELQQLWASEYKERYAKKERENVDFLKKFDRNWQQNQKTLAAHKAAWDTMSIRSKANATLKPLLPYFGGTAAVATIAFVFFFFGSEQNSYNS